MLVQVVRRIEDGILDYGSARRIVDRWCPPSALKLRQAQCHMRLVDGLEVDFIREYSAKKFVGGFCKPACRCGIQRDVNVRREPASDDAEDNVEHCDEEFGGTAAQPIGVNR